MTVQAYNYAYPMPSVTVDIVLLCRLTEIDALYVLLIKRKNDPYGDHWALPGGYMEIDETLQEAACRELNEETGILCYGLQMLGLVYDKPDRDPRGRVLSVPFMRSITGPLPEVNAQDDAKEVRWYTVRDAQRMKLAFDHNDILQVAVDMSW
jgi:8-oxo-dGTP diphosphatase